MLLHCVVDAITGALGLPDIGQLFPDNDPKWKGCTSDVFIAEACRLMREAGKATMRQTLSPRDDSSRLLAHDVMTRGVVGVTITVTRLRV